VLSDADTNTGWSNLTTLDPDIKVEGTNSVSGVTRNNGEDSYYDSGGAPVTAVGKVLRGWVNTTNLAYMAPEATNPYELWVFDGTSQSPGKALFGSDTYPGGWFYFWQDMDDFTGVTLANIDRWGIEAGHAASAKNVVNMWMDVMRYMDGYYLTGGTSGDKISVAELAATDKASAYGIVQEQFDAYFATGTIQIGNGATTTWFGMDGEVFIFLDMPGALTISAGLYEINAQGTGCDCNIKNSVVRGNGTGATTRFVLDFSDTDATVSITDNLFQRASTSTFAAGQTVTGNTFDDCGQIIPSGADMTGCQVKNYEGTVDTGAVFYNETADPDGEFDDMIFTKGTASTHAIEFGTSAPETINLTGLSFSGYNASNNQTDSTLYIKRTTGTTTINLSGVTGTVTYKSDGATVVINNNVSFTITVQDTDTDPIQNAVVAVYNSSTDAVLSNELTDVNGESTFSAAANIDFYARIRKSTTGSTRYNAVETVGNTGTGGSITVTLTENIIVSS
jgi:hypothetical protein